MIKILNTGIVYRNPRPHLESIHAWHPSIVQVPNGDLLSTFDLAEAGESLDYHTVISRSTDGGQSWSTPKRLFLDPVTRRSTHSIRLGAMPDGTLIGMGARFYRDDPFEGIVNRANLGYVPMDLFLIRSCDAGMNWNGPETVQPPLDGPGFELCHRVIELKDGRWLFPTSTWRGWHGHEPHGMQAIALVSHDKGKTWPDYLSVINQSDRQIISWEQGLTQLSDGRLLAIIWSFEEPTGKSLPNRYAISNDGKTFSAARENGMQGETAKLLTLKDGRVFCLYRRRDQPGLWASLIQIEGDEWVTLEETLVWQGAVSGMMGVRSNSDELAGLKFGYPSLIQLPDGTVFAVFWCFEDGLHIIRSYQFQLITGGI